MRVQSVVLSAVLALLLVSAQRSNAQTAPAAAPAAPTAAQPAVIPGNAPAQSQSSTQGQQYATQAPQYAPGQFFQASLQNAWVSECRPQVGPSAYFANSDGNLHKRLTFSFNTDAAGRRVITKQIVFFNDPLCSQPLTDVVSETGTWDVGFPSFADPSASQVYMTYYICRGGNSLPTDPNRGPCDKETELVKVLQSPRGGAVMLFGMNVPGGTQFNWDNRFYTAGSSPTDFIVPQ